MSQQTYMITMNTIKWGIGILIFCFLFITCKKEENKGATANPAEGKSSLTGLVLFAVGDVRIGDRKIKAGDIISQNESVLTGKKSSCDVQIQESDAGIVIRLKAESMFELKMTNVNGKPVPSTMVNIGNAMVNVSGKLKNDENFQVVTPTQTAGVRGTKFDVSVAKDGSTTVSVSEGKVATQVRVAEMDELPIEVQEKSKTITAVKKSLEAEEKIIEAGYQTHVTKSQTNKILKTTGLEDSISQVQFETKAKLSPEEIDKAVNAIDKNGNSTKLENSAPSKSVQEGAFQKVEKIPSKQLESKLNEYAELIAIEKKKLETKESTTLAVKERNEKHEEKLIQRMEEITGKSFSILNLKSGKQVRGIIFNENGVYFIITPDGQEAYQESEVDGIEL
jgi:hypothetical protein